MTYSELTGGVLIAAIALVSLCTLASLLRAIIGPSMTDRLVAINMTGTQGICLICLIAAHSGEGGFADVAIVYALLSFLAVSVLMRLLGGKDNK